MTGDRRSDVGFRRFRKGRAEARLRLPDHIRDRLEEGGEASVRTMEAARTAGELAARRVNHVVPNAAAAEITEVTIQYTWTEQGLQLAACVEGFSRTPLDARAMAAIQVVMLSLAEAYPEAAGAYEINGMMGSDVAGAGESRAFDPPVRAAVVVVSDAVVAGDKEDTAGETVRDTLDDLADQGVERIEGETLPDDVERIRETVSDLVERDVELIVTVGGTGVTHTDCTVEALEPMIDREIPGIMEAARSYGVERTPYAVISCGIAGLVGDTLAVTFPGSSSGARETCEALLPDILHVIRTRRRSRRELT